MVPCLKDIHNSPPQSFSQWVLLAVQNYETSHNIQSEMICEADQICCKGLYSRLSTLINNVKYVCAVWSQVMHDGPIHCDVATHILTPSAVQCKPQTVELKLPLSLSCPVTADSQLSFRSPAGVLMELLQNADDAGASKMSLLLDCMQYPVNSILGPSMTGETMTVTILAVLDWSRSLQITCVLARAQKSMLSVQVPQNIKFPWCIMHAYHLRASSQYCGQRTIKKRAVCFVAHWLACAANPLKMLVGLDSQVNTLISHLISTWSNMIGM